jgi:hypothetical protein
MKKYKTALIVLILALMVSPCTADIPPPYEKGQGDYIAINHCYRIENEDRYPGYIFGFYALPHPGGGFVALEQTPCYRELYHLAMPMLCALNRTVYNEKIAQSSEYIRDPSLVSSQYNAPTVVKAPRSTSLVSQTDILTITSLNSTSLVVKKVRSYNTYQDGHTEDISLPGITVTGTTDSPVTTTVQATGRVAAAAATTSSGAVAPVFSLPSATTKSPGFGWVVTVIGCLGVLALLRKAA